MVQLLFREVRSIIVLSCFLFYRARLPVCKNLHLFVEREIEYYDLSVVKIVFRQEDLIRVKIKY